MNFKLWLEGFNSPKDFFSNEENKYKKLSQPKVVVKYIPRSEYEAQMSDEEIEYLRLDEFFKNYENEIKI